MNSSARAIWKSSLLFAAAFFGQLALAAEPKNLPAQAWSTLGGSGSLRLAGWTRDRSYSADRGFLPASFCLNFKPEEYLGFQTFFDGYLASNDLIRSSPVGIEARELYIERKFGDFDLRVGRQVTVWGRADKVNPTDSLSTRNYKLLQTDDEDQRLGVFATQLTYNIQTVRLIAVYQPEWRAPIYPIPPLPGISVANLDPSGAERQFAFKLDQTGGTVDWSLSYFNGLSKVPDLKLVSAGAGGINVGLQYSRVDVLGGDFALNLGKFGIRAESAFTRTANSDGQDPLARNSEIFSTLGADYSVTENFNVNGQLLYRHVFNFQDPSAIGDPNTRALAIQESLISNQLGSDRLGLTLRPSFKAFNDTFLAEVALVNWFTEIGGLARPKITYAFTDSIKGIVGAEIYYGDSGSFFGRLASLTTVFAEVRLGF